MRNFLRRLLGLPTVEKQISDTDLVEMLRNEITELGLRVEGLEEGEEQNG